MKKNVRMLKDFQGEVTLDTPLLWLDKDGELRRIKTFHGALDIVEKDGRCYVRGSGLHHQLFLPIQETFDALENQKKKGSENER